MIILKLVYLFHISYIVYLVIGLVACQMQTPLVRQGKHFKQKHIRVHLNMDFVAYGLYRNNLPVGRFCVFSDNSLILWPSQAWAAGWNAMV